MNTNSNVLKQHLQLDAKISNEFLIMSDSVNANAFLIWDFELFSANEKQHEFEQ